MINEIIINVAKVLFGIGVLFLFLKLFLTKKEEKISKSLKLIIYNIHKASFILSTILGFIHGLTIIPINQTYVITGWLFGISTIILCVIGIRMGFKNKWTPYTKEERNKNKKVRSIKWILTILTIAFLGMHYLL